MNTISTTHKSAFSVNNPNNLTPFLTPTSSPGVNPFDELSKFPSQRFIPHGDRTHLSKVHNLVKDNQDASGSVVLLSGNDLTITQLQSIMRHGACVSLDIEQARAKVEDSVAALQGHLKAGHCIYGVTTGFGASADSRTKHPDILQAALLQMQHIGILPSMESGSRHTMPEEWVRGAMAIRINSLLRGHSAVRWEVLERLVGLLNINAIPIVPLRGSISASGDLSPLSYIAGAVTGHPGIYCFLGPERRTVTSKEALATAGLEPVEFRAKEVLGLINGTSVSCSVATQVVSDASMLFQVSQALTAMAVEVSLGSAEPFDPWIAAVSRPHPGQKEVAANIWHFLSGSKFARDRHDSDNSDVVGLRQDRYPLRTSPQWLGPQLEDLDLAISQLGIECNSTTDNPLLDTSGSGLARVIHAGNFQAMHVTAAMEKTRSVLQNTGKLMFQQLTEVVNYCTAPLPPNLASDCDPSLSYTMKAVDIAAAAYCSELGVLAAGNVGAHVQCAEDRNQAVNSLALVSARQANEMVDVLSMLMANYIYVLCQAADLRTMLLDFDTKLFAHTQQRTEAAFKGLIGKRELKRLGEGVARFVVGRFSETMREDANERFEGVFEGAVGLVVRALAEDHPRPSADPREMPATVKAWREGLVVECEGLFRTHRDEVVNMQMPAEKTQRLGACAALYRFVREELAVPMHKGQDDLPGREGATTVTVGEMVTRIYCAIRDGRVGRVVVGMLVGR